MTRCDMSLSGTTRWDHPHPEHTTGIVQCCDSANALAAKCLEIQYEFCLDQVCRWWASLLWRSWNRHNNMDQASCSCVGTNEQWGTCTRILLQYNYTGIKTTARCEHLVKLGKGVIDWYRSLYGRSLRAWLGKRFPWPILSCNATPASHEACIAAWAAASQCAAHADLLVSSPCMLGLTIWYKLRKTTAYLLHQRSCRSSHLKRKQQPSQMGWSTPDAKTPNWHQLWLGAGCWVCMQFHVDECTLQTASVWTCSNMNSICAWIH